MRGKGPVLLLTALCVLAAAGVHRLELDPDAAFALDPDDVVEAADRALREATGSDDLVAVVLRTEGSPLTADGFAAVDAVYERLVTEAALTRSRSVTRAPILGGIDGVLQATTPLHPLPNNTDLEPAVRIVLADRFAVGTLISPDGAVAVLPSWVRREGKGALLVGIAGKALQDDGTRATPEGGAAKRAIDEARLAVVLGDAVGPADAEVVRRLGALATDGNALAASWAVQSELLASDPESAALAAAHRALAGVELPEGVRGEVIGAAAVRENLAAKFPIAIGLLLIGLVAGLVVAGARSSGSSWVPAAAGIGGAAFVAGGLGWLGAPVHSQTALLPALALLPCGIAAMSARANATTVAAVLPLVGIAVASTPTPGLTAGLLLCAAAVLGIGVGLKTISAPEPSPGRLRIAMAAGLVGVAVLGMQPLGVDPGRFLDARSTLGATMRVLDGYGMAVPAQMALQGDAPRALATPAGLRALAAAQATLNAESSVQGTVSWADFVAALHHAVSGADGLPSDPALIDQYLLLFGRPDDVRPLVAPDFRVGGGLVRLAPGQAAHLGSLAGPVGDGPVVVTGAGARVARASWLAARRAAMGGCAGTFLAVLLLVMVGGSSSRGHAVVSLSAAALSVGVASWWAGALGVDAFLVGAVVWGALALGQGSLLLVGLGGFLAVVSPVVPVAAVGAGLGAGAALGALSGWDRSGTVRAR